MTLDIRTPALAALFALLAAGPVLAGASSENEINPKSLEGPGGKDAHSADPGNIIEGSPGPSGPSGAQDLNKGENAAGGASTGAGSGTSGSSTVPQDTQDGKVESKPKSSP
jgi:hypothetical protein